MTARPARPRTRGRPQAALLLTPGAGADRNQAALVAVDEAVAALGVTVERIDFPYRKAGRRSPDRQPVLVGTVGEEAAALSRRAGVPASGVWLGGRSMGGRMCSIAVAEGLPAAGLVLISYPLHPPGRREQRRTEHFPAVAVPCLFVSGTRDAFAAPDELEAATAAIPGPVTHVWVEGRDHGMRGGDTQVATAVAGWLSEQLRQGAPSRRRAGGPPG